MVCMGLRMSPRIFIQNIDLRDFFRHTSPATRKLSQITSVQYIRRTVEIAISQLASPPIFRVELLRRWSTRCWWVGSLIASPVSRMSVGQVNTGRHVNLGQSNCSPPVQYAIALCLSSDPVVSNRSPARFQPAGAVWGLWMIGLAKNPTNLWGCPCQISAQ